MKDNFEKMLDKAALKAIEEEQPEDREVKLSKAHEEKMKRLFARGKKKDNSFLKYAAAIAAVVVLVLFISTIKVGFKVPDKNNALPQIISHKDTRNDVEISYIPQGFEENSRRISSTMVILSYKKGSMFFRITVNAAEDVTADNIQITDGFKINGFDALYSENEGINSVFWSDEDRVLTVTGNIEKEEIIKIAEGIKHK